MKISVWDRLEVKDGDLKRDVALENEGRKATEEFSLPKIQKQQANNMDIGKREEIIPGISS